MRFPFEIFSRSIFEMRFSGIAIEIENENQLGIYLVELSSWNLDVNSELIIRGFWFYAIEIELKL